MSLIHWWLLNGDTQDKITNTQLTNNGATIVDNGKIGRCYTFNGSTNLTISYPSLNTLGSNPTKFSFALWIKINSTWTGWGQVFTIGRNGGAWTDIRIGFDIASDKTGYFTVSDGSSAASYNGPKHALTVGKWHHVAATFDNKEMKLFIDGQPASTPQATASVLPNLSSDTFIAIGGNGGENGECDMNDVRIYDHALSQAEVKELSKALIVHYTFNDVLAEPTTNVSTINGWSSYEPYFVISERTETGLKVYRPTNSTNTVLALNNSAVTGKMAAGEIWTFSCYLYVNGKPYKCTQSDMSTYKYSGISYYSNDEGYYTCTFTVGAPETWIIHAPMFGSVGTNVMCEIDRIQFEKKDHATPYTSGSRSSLLYNETGLAQPSTKNNIVLSTDSGVGTYSLNCQGNTEIIMPNVCDISQGVTISFWVKCSIPTDSRLIFADSHSQTAFGFFNNGQAIITCAGYGHACVSNIRTNWKSDWNHIIVQRNSSGNVSCYLNGVQLSLSGSQEWTHSVTDTLSIGCRYSGGWTSYFSGLIDDFRFYATWLSLNDIKEIYQTKAYISDKGDIMCTEFIEGKSQAQVTSKGIFEANEFYEDETNASIYDTQNVSGRNLIEI